MIEILENLELLKQASLDLAGLSLHRVRFGAPASVIDRGSVVEISGSPLVASSSSGTNRPSQYFDKSGRELSHQEVLESVIAADGMIHFADRVSFKITGGVVTGFALYGSQLNHFSSFRSQAQLIAEFGQPDHVDEKVSYGDLMGYDNFYFHSRKCVSWDEWGRRVSLINLGNYPRSEEVLRAATPAGS